MNKAFRNFILLFLNQFILYALWCVDVYFVAHTNYLLAASSDALYGTLTFMVIKKISTNENTLSGYFGYILGGVAGTILGIFLSKLLNK